MTGLVYHDDYLKHTMPQWHPEQPERLAAVVEHLKKTGLQGRLTAIAPRRAEVEWIAAIHSRGYIRVVEEVSRGGGLLDFGDTPVCPDSYDVARLAVGGMMRAVDAVMDGTVGNAFCLVRPPGHHARATQGMGFCIFNNIAIAARYLQKRHKLERILIADWDVHHGNGTQEAFYEDPTVLYFSVHRYGMFFPGTGAADERGAGAGTGYTINVPLSAGGGRAEFLRALQEQLMPAAEHFQPEFVLISAGYDAHRDDPLGGMKLATEDYSDMARIGMDIAKEQCAGRMVATLEGGYNLEALAGSVAETLRVFLGGERG
jgi:acetoin utilization deacetylase AcuC-like enzyme